MALTNKQLSHYRLDREIGQGGMATIYRATDIGDDRIVALKVLMPHWARDVVVLRRFQKEAENAKRLQHPNIAQVYDAGQEDGQYFIAMQYAGNGSLDRLIQRRKAQKNPMQVEEVIAYLRPIAAALDYAHSQGILHRDIKPSNVLIDEDEQILLADFGIARQMDPAATLLTMTNQTVGTPAYMSPEQTEGDRDIGPRADIYSFGVMAYEMLTNELPFSAPTPTKLLQKILDEPPAAPETFNPKLVPGVTFALRKVLAKDPANRYRSASEFLNGLERGLTWTPRPNDWATLTAATIPTSKPRPRLVEPERSQWLDRRLWIGAVLALFGLLAITFTAYSLWTQRTTPSQPVAIEHPTSTSQTPIPSSTTAATIGDNTELPATATIPGQIVPTSTFTKIAATVTPSQNDTGTNNPTATMPNGTSTPVSTLTPIPSPTTDIPAILAAQLAQAQTATAVALAEMAAAQAATSAAKTATAVAQPTLTHTPTNTPAATSANFAGTWYSNFSELHLNQEGTHVSGDYTWYGDGRSWAIEGTIEDRKLHGYYMNEKSTDFAFTLSPDSKSFDGYWFYRTTNQQVHWCGVRSGPLPAGCGFSGTWQSRSDYCYNRQPNIELSQEGRLLHGTFDNGNPNGTGRVEGTIGGFGDASQYSVRGNFTMDADGFQDQFQWDLVDLQDQQFTGWWQNNNGQHSWCGWRVGMGEPAGCGAPPDCSQSSGEEPKPSASVPDEVWQTVSSYFDALNGRDFATAYGLLSSFFRKSLCNGSSVCTVEQFGAGFQSTPETYIDPANVTKPHPGSSNRYVFTAQESIKNKDGWGLSSPRTYCLLYENDVWKIHGIKLAADSKFCD